MQQTHLVRLVRVASCLVLLLAPQLGARPTVQDGEAPLELRRGDTLCLLGNALAERMQHEGWLEARLQSRFSELGLSVRNLGFGGDEVGVHQRTMNFGKFSTDEMALDLPNEPFTPWDRYLDHVDASVIFAFFGYNESFAGAAGLATFRGDLVDFIDHVLAQRYDGSEAPELVLFSSIPHEDLGDADHPDGREHNARIAAYNTCIAEVARARGVRFVDLFAPLQARYAAAAEPLTINGIHLTAHGNEVLAEVIETALFGIAGESAEHGSPADGLRELVMEKNRLWFQRYRATDGYNVYGDRSRLVYAGADGEGSFANFDILQRELDHLDGLVAIRDRAIWALASGEPVVFDDASAPSLLPVPTNKRGPGPGGEHEFLYGSEAVARMTTAPGMRIEVFADERQFPELVNPVQMSWDTRGRLWVAVWPTYPHWRPDQPLNDKLLILEDTDGDGRADECTVFADGLHNPTGFEFWNGGVLLAGVPDLLFLEDTDGDDRADASERLLHGLSSADTHHSANSFVLGPDGALYFQEGTFHQSQVESIFGPVRNRGGCVWRFEPRTHRVERYIPYGFANPHGHVFDRWGQDFMTDGTGNVNYYALPFSGHLDAPARHASYFPFFKQRSRPAGGTEILSSGHFPTANQGNYLIANVIGFRGVFQYEVVDDGSGFSANEVSPIVESTDLNFRPVDLEMGPDGALYLLDWHNPLIGHMQHHLRDPSRDAEHGRVYRVSCEGRAPLEPPTIQGAPIPALLELLKSPEDRTRYRARIELSARDSDEVVRAARDWARSLEAEPGGDSAHEHALLEALWVHQQHNRMDRELLGRLLEATDFRARAAATRVLRYGRQHVPDALELLAARAGDAHPRVRLEAVVAASFFDSAAAASIALSVLRHPTDPFIDYALGETLRGLEERWQAALRAGEPLAADNPAGIEYLLARVGPAELVALPRTPAVLHAILTRHGLSQEARRAAATELAAGSGSKVSAVVLAALAAVDAGPGAHAAHIQHELGQLLAAAEDSPRREALVALVESGRLPVTRSIGYAALIAHDHSVEPAWQSAGTSSERLIGLVGSLAMIEDPALRDALGERVRPLMFSTPAGTEEQRAGTGLDVALFEPAPPDALLETFAERGPQQALHAATFTLELPAVRESDSFGLRFQGLLFAPTSGSYTFTTASDDGSRLYIADQCVVDNDGAHGLVSQSGTIELAAGPHAVTVTYYEQGGAEGLVVTWEGPGIARQPIPPGALGRGQGAGLRAAAVRAMAHVPARADQKLSDAVRLLSERSLLGPALELVASVPLERRAPAQVSAVLDALTALISGLPAQERTTPPIVAALEAGRRLSASLPEAEAARAWARLDELGGTVVLIRTLPHQMRYDVTEFWVEAGQPVSLVFQNNDVMPHNLVVTLPGALAEVGRAAESLSAGSGTSTTDYIPDLAAVQWHTRLLMPGESERLDFIAPAASADHPFVCTYPGHWRVMNGVMHVVDELAPEERVAQRGVGLATPATSTRKFVRDWKIEELAPLLVEDWERGRSPARGRELFDAAGCIKCHTGTPADFGSGPTGGPDLAAIRDKYDAEELLLHIVQPSLEIVDDYGLQLFELAGGSQVSGRVLADDGANLHVLPNLLEPENVFLIAKGTITERTELDLSAMPTGLLVTFDEGEILDLLSFLREPSGSGAAESPEPPEAAWAVFEGGQGPGAGKHVVLLAGDEEYRSEEALPMLARILSTHHGFRCTVLFSSNPETGEIDPEEQTHIPGMHLLADADMLVVFLRFRELPDADMAHFVEYVESGKPILGLRTATHAFDYRRNPASPYAHYGWKDQGWPGGFGQQVLGETWISHHGQHGSQSTRGLIAEGREEHPILRGVDDVWGPTDVYGVRNLGEDATVLLRGQVLDGMQPTSTPAAGAQNSPMLPLVWTRELERGGDAVQRIVCSTIGASVDCRSEGLRRLLVNSIYWGVGLEDSIPAASRVDHPVEYAPTFFGFGKHRRGQRASDFAAD